MYQEIEKNSDLLYQNREREGYAWFEANRQAIHEAMIMAWQEKYQSSADAKEVMMYLIGVMADAWNRCDTLALADVLRYEILAFIG